MMNNWNNFTSPSLPVIEDWVLVYALDTNPSMNIAKWTGEGGKWLISLRGDLKYFEGIVTHWMELPESPDF